MSTKEDPGQFDCLARALPDEPYFVLLGRDSVAPTLVYNWAMRRKSEIAQGKRPSEDAEQVRDAIAISDAMTAWRRENFGRWRTCLPPDPRLPGPWPLRHHAGASRDWTWAPAEQAWQDDQYLIQPDELARQGWSSAPEPKDAA